MGRRAARIELSEEERDGLERLIRASLTPQQLAMRARIVLLLGEGLGIEGTADRLGIWRKTVSASLSANITETPAPLGIIVGRWR